MTDAPKPSVPPIELIKILDIKVGERGRQDVGDVQGLAENIKLRGLLHPLILTDQNELVAGFRRLTACMLLGLTEVPIRRWGVLDPLEQKQIELEENIKRKQLTWQEEVQMTEQLHALMILKTPIPLPDPNRGAGQPPKAWGLKDTAELLGTSIAKVSQDVALAKSMAAIPGLAQTSSKTNAMRKLRKELELAAIIEMQSRNAAMGTSSLGSILHGSCADLLPSLAPESVDLVITDPPWGIEIGASAREWVRMHEGFADDAKYAVDITELALKECYRVLRNGSHLYLFCAWEFMRHWQEFLVNLGFWVRPNPLVWVKGNVTAGQPYWMFMGKTECIIFAHKGQGGRPLVTPSSDVLQYDAPRTRIHPTEKPVEMLRYMISLSTVEGEMVLDPFAGSGATVKAAMLSNRKGIGIELSEQYHKLAAANILDLENMNATGTQSN